MIYKTNTINEKNMAQFILSIGAIELKECVKTDSDYFDLGTIGDLKFLSNALVN